MQMPLIVAIALLVGMASGGIVWFGTGLAMRLQIAIGDFLAARKAKQTAKEDAAKESPGGR